MFKIIDPLGNETQTEYDLAGNEKASIDVLGQRTEMDYDAYGRLTRMFTIVGPKSLWRPAGSA